MALTSDGQFLFTHLNMLSIISLCLHAWHFVSNTLFENSSKMIGLLSQALILTNKSCGSIPRRAQRHGLNAFLLAELQYSNNLCSGLTSNTAGVLRLLYSGFKRAPSYTFHNEQESMWSIFNCPSQDKRYSKRISNFPSLAPLETKLSWFFPSYQNTWPTG